MNFDGTLAFVAADYISGIQNLSLRPPERTQTYGYPQENNPTNWYGYSKVAWDDCVCEPWRRECDCGAKEKGSPRQGY